MSESRLGIALSGGGFRAALFHIGVLARMAELGLLRGVEAISTVSGGSIIGALYYLHVKRLLESKPDAQITDADYIEIVRRIEVDFPRAVQTNFRMRTFLDPLKTLRMALPNYSRSDRIAELFDRDLYRPVLDPQGTRATPIEMRELKIEPKGGPAGFHPLKHNAGRNAKAPVLLINATTLNGGHNWRFEAARMGEPPNDSATELDLDSNLRLVRADDYAGIVAVQETFELGHAVAASAAVPGLFVPMSVSDMYGASDGAVRVQLVDGGVYDNQGMRALVDPSQLPCTHIVVSDASAQLGDRAHPETGAGAVILRANDILMEQVRRDELIDLKQEFGNRAAVVHLRRGLPPRVVSYNDTEGKPAPLPAGSPLEGLVPTTARFGIHPEVQQRISRIRTDLDSFTDIEAWSLMYDAYRMSESELAVLATDFGRAPATKAGVEWVFSGIKDWMAPDATPDASYLKHLDVASERFLKVFRLSWTTTVVTVAFLVVLAMQAWEHWGSVVMAYLDSSITYRALLITVATMAIGALLPKLGQAFQVFRFLRNPVLMVYQGLGLGVAALVGGLVVGLHLLVFDRLFLRLGQARRLKK